MEFGEGGVRARIFGRGWKGEVMWIFGEGGRRVEFGEGCVDFRERGEGRGVDFGEDGMLVEFGEGRCVDFWRGWRAMCGFWR